ncbi:hypothetical protein PPROV_000852400 [Pycnococcus provasolii]|uniref:Uncharacterized protein n=1 Tax=Pycnococcus provasolii TaxID=41880 RepID=A0A830HY13_9CHLO|nr:hypothetical protein PPROV_000852400 [Pycnococcus provasolii]
MASSQAVMARVAAQHEVLGLKSGLLGDCKPDFKPNTSCCAATRAITACDDAMAPTSWQDKPYHLPGGDKLSRQGATVQPYNLKVQPTRVATLGRARKGVPAWGRWRGSERSLSVATLRTT